MLEPLPGAAPFPERLARRLADAVRAKGAAYRPRTHHLAHGHPRFTNRLVLERSPYLLQHAHNPVSWWAWGDAPFEEARRTGRPVFLSVGYSTCHWCHVMERESFEDLEIARVLNERFVPIKVDREERPDVDTVYMTAVQLLQGGGGWPMSVWLTPDREPFFGGTYFPPRDGARGMTRGFLGVLLEIADLYARDPDRVRGATGSLVQAVRTALAAHGEPAADLPGPGAIGNAVAFFEGSFDAAHGGVRRAPKFPSNLPVRLLLRHHRRTREPEPLRMATLTLEKMAAGGIHDQLGGGFHRYSTDAEWLVPHFEKMLYDNALLAVAYAEAWQVTQRRDLARVVRQTLDYLVREMTSPEGGLYSATDADSEGEEGRFFVWEEKELRARVRRPGARRAAPRRGGRARRGVRARADGEGRPPPADLARRRGGGPGVPRGSRLPRGGAPRPARGDVRAALARGGGGPVRAAGGALRRRRRRLVPVGRGPRPAHRAREADARRRGAVRRVRGDPERPAAPRVHDGREVVEDRVGGAPALRRRARGTAGLADRDAPRGGLRDRRRARGRARLAREGARAGAVRGGAAPDLPAEPRAHRRGGGARRRAARPDRHRRGWEDRGGAPHRVRLRSWPVPPPCDRAGEARVADRAGAAVLTRGPRPDEGGWPVGRIGGATVTPQGMACSGASAAPPACSRSAGTCSG